MKVIFPQVAGISVSRNIFASVKDSARTDTVNLALIRFTSPMNESQTRKLREYLEARLKLKNIRIVNTGNIISTTQ